MERESRAHPQISSTAFNVLLGHIRKEPEKYLLVIGAIVASVWLAVLFSYALVTTQDTRVPLDPQQTTIMVAGGAGYIGSHIVADLVAHKYNVVVYDSLYKGHKQAIAGLPNVAFVKGDVRDASRLDEAMVHFKPKAVMHFCADSLVGESVIDPLKYYDNNVGGAISLLKAMKRHDINYIVFSSTAAIFGDPGKEAKAISEDTPKAPKNPYGETKLAIERMLHWASEAPDSKLRYVALRYFNAAGAHPTRDIGEDHSPETHLIPNIMKSALSASSPLKVFGNKYDTRDGTCVRDYIHVMDLSAAHILGLEWMMEHNESNRFNLGNGNGFTVTEVLGAAESATGKKIPSELAPPRAGDPPTLVADASLAREMLKWNPQYDDVENIIKTAWRWHRSHPNGYN